jgi:hypothetical protein
MHSVLIKGDVLISGAGILIEGFHCIYNDMYIIILCVVWMYCLSCDHQLCNNRVDVMTTFGIFQGLYSSVDKL